MELGFTIVSYIPSNSPADSGIEAVGAMSQLPASFRSSSKDD